MLGYGSFHYSNISPVLQLSVTLLIDDLQLRLECTVARPIRPVAASRFNHDHRAFRYRMGDRLHPRDIFRRAPNRIDHAAALAC